MSTIVDTYITYRIITTLTKDWDEQDAYKYGIIDEKGKPIIKSRNLKSRKEKEAYSTLIRFIFNLKRIIEKIPGGKSKLGSYAATALLFLKEEEEKNEKEIL